MTDFQSWRKTEVLLLKMKDMMEKADRQCLYGSNLAGKLKDCGGKDGQ